MALTPPRGIGGSYGTATGRVYRPPVRPAPGPAPRTVVPIVSAASPAEAAFQGRTPEEILALAQQLAGIAEQPSRDAIARGQAQAGSLYNAQVTRTRALSSALDQIFAGVNVAKPYEQSAKTTEAFGRGYAHGLQLAMKGSASEANDLMTRLAGAPEAQKIDSGKASDAADVLAAVGGGIPAEAFRQEGSAWQSGFGRFPQQTDAQKLLEELTAKSQLSQLTQGFADQLGDLAKQNPLVVAQYLDELYGMERQDKQDFQATEDAKKQQAMSLYDAGLITQRSLATSLSLPNPGSYANKTKGELTPVEPKFQTVGDTLLEINPQTGKTSIVYQAPQEAAALKALQHVTIGGKAYTFDPNSGRYYDPATGKLAAPKGAPKQPSTRLSFQNIGGHRVAVDPYTGKPVIDYGPTATAKTAKAKPLSVGQRQRGVELADRAFNGYYTLPGSDEPLSTAQLRQLMKQQGVDHPADLVDDDVAVFQKLTYQEALQRLLSLYWTGYLAEAQRQLNQHWTRNAPGARVTGGQILMPWEKKGQGRPLVPIQQRQGKAPAAAETAARNTTGGKVPNGPAAQYIVNEARQWIGTPYSWGGGTPAGPSYGTGRGAKTKGFDCSAFVQFLYAKEGVSLPRTTYDQIKVGRPVLGAPLQAGDILFFGTPSDPHHEGMYIGDGKFIEAPYTGSSVRVSSLSSRSDLVAARRVL